MTDTNTRDAITRLEERMTEVEFKVGLLKNIEFSSGTLNRWALDCELEAAQYESTLRTLQSLDVARRNGNVGEFAAFETTMAGAIGSHNIHQRCNLLVLALQREHKYDELTAPLVGTGWYDKFNGDQ